MAEQVKFGQNFTQPRVKKQKGLILYPPRQNKFIIIRFIGSQHKMYQKWEPITKKYFCSEDKKEGFALRIVSFVVDRESSKIKAFICPRAAFKQMGEFGLDHDFKIVKRGSGLQTTYDVESLGETSVSQELLDMMTFTSQAYSFSDIFIKKVEWEVLSEKGGPILDRFELLDL